MTAIRGLPDWIRHNVVGLVVTAAVSGAVGYVVNVWLMAVRYEGSVTPEGAPAVSKDNVLAGGIFWAMFPMVVCSAIGYRRAVGGERFWQDVRRLPMTLVGLFRRDGSHGWVHLLWGAAIALAATLIVPPAVGAVLGVGLLIGAPSIVGSVLSSAFAQLWRLVGKVVAPTKDHRVAPVLKIAVGILGWAVALVIGFVLPGEWIRLVLALGCAAGAFVLGRKVSAGTVPATAAALVFGYLVVDLITAVPALADDGGFAECGSTLEGWIRNCGGAGEIRRRALIGAIIAAQFGAIGFIFGGAVGSAAVTSGGGAWWDRLGLDELPRGPLDPATGEALVVNDGRWPDVPVGHVYFEGEWAHPEAVGAIATEADESPFAPGPATADDDPALRPALWVPPLVAAILASASSAGAGGASARSADRAAARAARSTRAAEAEAEQAAAARAQTLVDEAESIRSELAAAATEEERTRLHTALRTKAVAIAGDPTARQLVAARTTGLQAAITAELDTVDTQVMGVFVERLNDLGVSRGNAPVDATDVAELRDNAQQRNAPQVSPGGLRQLWKGYGSKKGKFAIDAATYLQFLEARLADQPPDGDGDDDRAALERKVERLRGHVAEGVTTVMVTESVWNDVAQFAYELAHREVTGAAPPV